MEELNILYTKFSEVDTVGVTPLFELEQVGCVALYGGLGAALGPHVGNVLPDEFIEHSHPSVEGFLYSLISGSCFYP